MEAKHNKNDQSEIHKNLEEQFQKLGADTEAPKDLKKEVFNTLDTLQLMGDIADLFTAKFTQSEAELMDVVTPNKEEEEEQ